MAVGTRVKRQRLAWATRTDPKQSFDWLLIVLAANHHADLHPSCWEGAFRKKKKKKKNDHY